MLYSSVGYKNLKGVIKMKILLAALNAKYIHTSLPLRSLKKYAFSYEKYIDTEEYTINNDEKAILEDIFEKNPDVVGFSCYIWNINIIMDIAENLKKVLPDVFIFLGGPEVSFDSEKILENNSFIDAVIRGEGEETFRLLASFFINGKPALEHIDGITFRNEEKITANPPRSDISLDSIPFVYDDVSGLENRIIYYESQRGCPYNCQFCLSSIEGKVRFLSKKRTFSDLDFFIKNRVKQVKFVDRTFNCNKKHAHTIWKYCMENDNGFTNFHMEIEAHILDDSEIDFLKNARRGLFQFEIGVQSTNLQTLSVVKRNCDFETLAHKVKKIHEGKNIHVHLDLIAGLPFEDYSSFAKSFNDVYSLHPEQLQLGFLKLLKGSGLRRDAKKYGIVFDEKAPYEVLYTNEMPYSDMLKLKAVEDIVETYYNSGKTVNTIFFTVTLFPSPFDFFEEFSNYWHEKNYHKFSHNKQELYKIFYEFCLQSNYSKDSINEISDLLKYDYLLSDNLRALYFWLDDDINIKDFKHDFFNNAENVKKYIPHLYSYSPSQLSRICRVSLFKYDVLSYNWDIPSEIKKKDTYVLFDYSNRDIITNHASVFGINKE
jgi:radical SAM superfamily enzyme YgiQ (UPF0313 family)